MSTKVQPTLPHREPEHLLISNKNNCTVIYLCPCVFFELFRRDLNEAKRVAYISYISEYYLICALITSQVSSNVNY